MSSNGSLRTTQMTAAVKNQIPIVVILGDEEEKEDSVSVKVPSQDRQFKVKKADLIQTIRETLAAIAAEPAKVHCEKSTS